MVALHPLNPIAGLSLAALVLVAGVSDFRFRLIPNWLNLAGCFLGFLINGVLFRVSGLETAAAGLLLAVLIYLPLYIVRGMAAGDVKLMAAVGAIVGPSNWFWIFIAAALSGGVIGLTLAIAAGRLRQTLFHIQIICAELAHFRAPHRLQPALDVRRGEGLRLPHGVAIAIGAFVFLIALRYAPVSSRF